MRHLLIATGWAALVLYLFALGGFSESAPMLVISGVVMAAVVCGYMVKMLDAILDQRRRARTVEMLYRS